MIIAEEHPLTADLELLFQRHTADMHADTPPESIHMMDKGELAAPGIRFFVLREAGVPLVHGYHGDDQDAALIKPMLSEFIKQNPQVFAELIIKECEVALKPPVQVRDVISRGQAYDNIKEHFGVK